MTQPVFIEYLSFLRETIPTRPMCLVLDHYPTHFTTESENAAARLGIKLVKVPKGATGIWQPLDRRVYGAMKSKARARWARLFAQPNIPRATKALAAESALQCWKELTNDLILSAWEFDEVFDDESADDGADEDDETYVDVEYGHDDLEQDDLDLMEMGWKSNDPNE
jgi:hypothetical protein